MDDLTQEYEGRPRRMRSWSIRSGRSRALPSVGDVVRASRLGSEATYRVCQTSARHVEVEVIAAPGLRAGQRFWFTRPAVAEMEPVGRALETPTRASIRSAGATPVGPA